MIPKGRRWPYGIKHAKQSSLENNGEDPSQHRYQTSQNQQPGKRIERIHFSIDFSRTGYGISVKNINREKYNLLVTAWTIMIFMPQTIHRRAEKTDSKHKWHHATNNCSYTWFRPALQKKWSKVRKTDHTHIVRDYPTKYKTKQHKLIHRSTNLSVNMVNASLLFYISISTD